MTNLERRGAFVAAAMAILLVVGAIAAIGFSAPVHREPASCTRQGSDLAGC